MTYFHLRFCHMNLYSSIVFIPGSLWRPLVVPDWRGEAAVYKRNQGLFGCRSRKWWQLHMIERWFKVKLKFCHLKNSLVFDQWVLPEDWLVPEKRWVFWLFKENLICKLRTLPSFLQDQELWHCTYTNGSPCAKHVKIFEAIIFDQPGHSSTAWGRECCKRGRPRWHRGPRCGRTWRWWRGWGWAAWGRGWACAGNNRGARPIRPWRSASPGEG